MFEIPIGYLVNRTHELMTSAVMCLKSLISSLMDLNWNPYRSPYSSETFMKFWISLIYVYFCGWAEGSSYRESVLGK